MSDSYPLFNFNFAEDPIYNNDPFSDYLPYIPEDELNEQEQEETIRRISLLGLSFDNPIVISDDEDNDNN